MHYQYSIQVNLTMLAVSAPLLIMVENTDLIVGMLV